ncbi:hypothetical protein BOX15_Mlig026297g1 [Macrostomum lignano]|uniref:Uncharacterized protein n=1 Tax=Macrostomum lignano TaxID=282301 RepID=A0A267GEQ2_9PLAT|nr:hypothetical protein BOX15_Mlig026297g1 [Macrostomum lignano]
MPTSELAAASVTLLLCIWAAETLTISLEIDSPQPETNSGNRSATNSSSEANATDGQPNTPEPSKPRVATQGGDKKIASRISPTSQICRRLTSSISDSLSSLQGLLARLSLTKQDQLPQVVPPSTLAHFSTGTWRLTSPSGRRLEVRHLQDVASRAASMSSPVPNVAHFVLPRVRSADSDGSGGTDLRFHELVNGHDGFIMSFCVCIC